MSIRTLFFASLLSAAASGAFAQDVGWHPAVSAAREPAGLDASTFVVGHPASPRWTVTHANHEHPAVVMHRERSSRGLNANAFIVQPPAHVEWTVLNRNQRLAYTAASGIDAAR